MMHGPINIRFTNKLFVEGTFFSVLAMKPVTSVERQLHSILTSTLDGGLVVSFTLWPFYPRTATLGIGVVPQSRSKRSVIEKSHLTRRDSNPGPFPP